MPKKANNSPYVPCAVDGCERPQGARSYCRVHDFQVKRGVPLRPIRPRRSPKLVGAALEAWFWSQTAITADGHRIWTGKVDKDGYGSLTIRGRSSCRAHRVAYAYAHGEAPADMHICHIPGCRDRRCCEPTHLYAGTAKDNSGDRFIDGTDGSGERHWTHIRPTHRPFRGSGHHNAILCKEDVECIRAKCAAGVRYKDLSEEYGVTRSAIGGVVRRQSWKHVD